MVALAKAADSAIAKARSSASRLACASASFSAGSSMQQIMHVRRVVGPLVCAVDLRAVCFVRAMMMMSVDCLRHTTKKNKKN